METLSCDVHRLPQQTTFLLVMVKEFAEQTTFLFLLHFCICLCRVM